MKIPAKQSRQLPCLSQSKFAGWIKRGCNQSLRHHKQAKTVSFPMTTGKDSRPDQFPEVHPEQHTQDSLQVICHFQNTGGQGPADD